MEFYVKRARLLGAITLCVLLSSGYGQDSYQEVEYEPASIDESRWEKATEDREYFELSEKKPPKEVEEEESDLDVPFDWSSISWLVYILIGVLVVFVVFLLVQVITTKQNTRVKATELDYQSIEDIKENLEEAELDRFLRLAIEEGDFRLAIRIMYLMMLQEMQRREWIDYRKDKTNFNYVMEMGSRPEGMEFTRLTQAFELIWYGNVDFGAKQFEVVRPPFNNYLDSLKSDEQGS